MSKQKKRNLNRVGLNARLKNQVSEGTYVPCRAGRVNEETQYVLDYHKAEVPELIEDVRTQIRDIEIRRIDGVKRDISLKKAGTKTAS